MSIKFMKEIIKEFLLERKNDKIKKIKSDLSEEERQEVLNDLENQFSLKLWIEDASKRASQLYMVSHPSKFSHPNAQTSAIISDNKKENDGYLRSGNVEYELDVLGNAAALDVYKFLLLKDSQENTILSHLEKSSDEIKSIFSNENIDFQKVKEGFLLIKKPDKSKKTNRLVKQVYFPITNSNEKESYHLLSILTPSGLLVKVKEQIDNIRFSENSKKVREFRKKNKQPEENISYEDILDLTMIGYGGTKPQNISVLNSRNGGKFYLLSSLPPELEKRKVRLPNNNFFKDTLWIKNYEKEFGYLNKVIFDKRNNIKNRDFRAELINSTINKVLEEVFKIRDFGKGWSNEEHYEKLPKSQKIWLDDFYLKDRENNEDKDSWDEEISSDFARWIINSYKKLFKDKAQELSDTELQEIKTEAQKAILITKEV